MYHKPYEIAKKLTLKKGVGDQPVPLPDRLAKFLFNYRTTPHTTTGVTPAELLLRWNLQTRFHKLYPNRREEVEKHQAQQKRDHDNCMKRCDFQPGDCVFARNFTGQGDKMGRRLYWSTDRACFVLGGSEQ